MVWSFQIRKGLIITWKFKEPLGFELTPQIACFTRSNSIRRRKSHFQGRNFDFEKVSQIASECIRMLRNDVLDVPKWLGTLQRSYIEHMHILKKFKKIHFFQKFSNFQGPFLNSTNLQKPERFFYFPKKMVQDLKFQGNSNHFCLFSRTCEIFRKFKKEICSRIMGSNFSRHYGITKFQRCAENRKFHVHRNS